MLADSRPAALLARASYAAVRADARPAALLALATLAAVLADARPAALLALASSVVVARRCSPRSIACIRFLCSCARRCCQMPSPLHCLQSLKIRRCSHVLDPGPSHCQLWLFWRLCGHFARFFLTVSSLALLPLTPSCCCFWALLPSSDKGRFLFSTASSLPLTLLVLYSLRSAR